MKRYLIVLMLTALASQAALAAAPPWATYTVTFDATWSAETHPQNFPGNAHFSGLIGGTHQAAAVFWAEGNLATTGIKQMAEWGSQAALAAEVEAEIAAGNAGEVIFGGWVPVSPGQATASFTVQPEFSLVTLVTMIAPSPDWFAGVAGLELLVQDQWVQELVVPLYPEDAGTDSGLNYTSADLPTNPAVAVAAIVGPPFVAGVPVGTFTFRLEAAATVAVPGAATALSARPNPFNPATMLHYVLPNSAREVTLVIYDARGRVVRHLVPARGAGPQATSWDGRTDTGLRAASGAYFAKLAVDGAVMVHKMALVQ